MNQSPLTAHPLLTEIRRPLSRSELFALARAPMSGLPRIGKVPDPRLDAATMAETLTALEDGFQLSRLVFLIGCILELWPAFDAKNILATAVLERLPGLVLDAARAGRALVRPAEELEFRALVDRVREREHPGLPALLGAHLLCMGAMTLLARNPGLRQEARGHGILVGAAKILAEVVAAAAPLRQMLDNVERLELLVLHPEQRRGHIVEATRVRNGFQLFALLDELLLGPGTSSPLRGPPVDPRVGQLARGEAVTLDCERLTSPYEFYNWSAWTKDGLAQDRAARLVWGEFPIHRIPRLNDRPLVLMGSPWLDRGWSPAWITPLHGDYQPRTRMVRALVPDEVAGWLALAESASPADRADLRYAGT